METPSDSTFFFGEFQFAPNRKFLLRNGEPVRIGGRAFDLLTLLVSRNGEVVSREELVAFTWPKAVVEESSLRVHIAALRKSLGETESSPSGYIRSVPGRGYSFVAPVVSTASKPVTAEQHEQPQDNLPVRISRVIGRDDEINQLAAQLAQHRLVTVVGHGGIGKTTVALALAARTKSLYQDGVWFVDLAPLVEPTHIWGALGMALGVAIPVDRPLETLSKFLRSSNMLIVLDNCEHVIDIASTVAEAALKEAGVHILATSREPLNANGEKVHHLSTLSAPQGTHVPDASAAIQYPAIELFVERAMASSNTFIFGDAEAALASELCRKLDGIPLALEFAAARVGVLGIEGVVSQLTDRIRLLSAGRRTALPRHRTLRALLDWSYDLLSPEEQILFTRLGVFRGTFTLEDIQAVAGDASFDERLVEDCVVGLITKSLVNVVRTESGMNYRLLEITRVYAYARLLVRSDAAVTSLSHTRHMLYLLRRAEHDWQDMERYSWIGLYSKWQYDIRAAHQWAFSDEGDPLLGIELTVAYIPVAMHFPAVQELRQLCDQALSKVNTGTPGSTLDVAWLHTGRWYFDHQVSIPPWDEVSPETDPPDNLRDQLLHLYWRFAEAHHDGNYRAAEASSTQSLLIAEILNDAPSIAHATRLLTVSHHFIGKHDSALTSGRSLLASRRHKPPLALSSSLDTRVSVKIYLARSEWMQGRAEDARGLIHEATSLAAKDPIVSICQVLTYGAIFIALWRGDLVEADDYNANLLATATKYGLQEYSRWAELLAPLIKSMIGDASRPSTENILRDASVPQLDHLATIDDALLTPTVIGRAETGEVGWCAPEAIRAQGEQILRTQGLRVAQEAEQCFRRALAISVEQSATAWGLRAATSLARLLRAIGQENEARAQLETAYNSVLQGRGTKDALSAAALLDELC